VLLDVALTSTPLVEALTAALKDIKAITKGSVDRDEARWFEAGLFAPVRKGSPADLPITLVL
jgi:hypothetical protein